MTSLLQVAAVEELEQRIDEQKILLQEKRERADAVLSEYQAEQSVCKDNLDQMWAKCNQCITQKCLNYYADNCEAKLAEKIEEDEIVPPCRQKPNSPCNNRNKPPTPRVSGSMQIIVNGKPVSNMDDALEHIKEQMAKTVTPPCEPGSKFEQFSSLVSMSSSSGPKQISQTTSKTISGTAGDGNSIGKMLLEQSENYSPDDRVNIGINMNGQVHNFTSFGELFSNQEIMAKLDELDDRMSKFGMKTDRQVTQRKESQPSRQTFTYSTSSRSGSAPSSDSTIRQSGCSMSPESAGGLPAVQQSAVQSPCSQQRGGERDELEETKGSSCGGCKTYQHVSTSSGTGNDAIMDEINAKLNSMMSQAMPSGQTQVNFKSSSTGGQPTAGLSEQIVKNGQLSPDGKTFTYSWTSNGTDEDIDIDEIMSLLTQKFDRLGPSLSRSSRNIKEQLTRHQGPISLDRTKRAVSQCAIEQAAREAQIERAKKLAALAKRGGFDNACSMLTRTYGQAVTDKLVEQFFTQIRERVRKVKEMCEAAGNCGSTAVHINFKTESSSDCAESEPNCPNAQSPGTQPQQPAEQPEQREPSPDSSLNRISARLQSWSQSSSGSWSTSTSSRTSSSGSVTQEETKPQTNSELNVNQGRVKVQHDNKSNEVPFCIETKCFKP